MTPRLRRARRRPPSARALATVLDNSPAFVALDEATVQQGIAPVPLPQFFTAAQMRHALQAAGVDTLWMSPSLAATWPGLSWGLGDGAGERPANQSATPGTTP